VSNHSRPDSRSIRSISSPKRARLKRRA
jgi:hypothetical protein